MNAVVRCRSPVVRVERRNPLDGHQRSLRPFWGDSLLGGRGVRYVAGTCCRWHVSAAMRLDSVRRLGIARTGRLRPA